MGRWLQVVGAVLLLHALLSIGMAALFGELRNWRSVRLLGRVTRRFRRRRAEVVPLRRPVEVVGADLRRLHASFHREGLRFAKYEGCRQAYDRVLGEAADMVGVTHLVAVLPAGRELDRERVRVEELLEDAGLLQRPWAA